MKWDSRYNTLCISKDAGSAKSKCSVKHIEECLALGAFATASSRYDRATTFFLAC